MPDWILQLLGYAGAAGAIYGGIRADLRATHSCALEAKAIAVDAHQKIFNHIAGGTHGKA